MKGLLWWLNEAPQEQMDYYIAGAMNVAFLGLTALLLWPLDKTMMIVHLAKGYGIFWSVTVVTLFVGDRLQRLFRVNVDSHFDAYVIWNLSHSLILLAGWSAFAALTVRSFVVTTPVWAAVILYLVGLLSSYVAFVSSVRSTQGLSTERSIYPWPPSPSWCSRPGLRAAARSMAGSLIFIFDKVGRTDCIW